MQRATPWRALEPSACVCAYARVHVSAHASKRIPFWAASTGSLSRAAPSANRLMSATRARRHRSPQTRDHTLHVQKYRAGVITKPLENCGESTFASAGTSTRKPTCEARCRRYTLCTTERVVTWSWPRATTSMKTLSIVRVSSSSASS